MIMGPWPDENEVGQGVMKRKNINIFFCEMITVTHKIFLYVPKIRVCNLLPFQEMITAIKGEFQWKVVWERLLKCGTKI